MEPADQDSDLTDKKYKKKKGKGKQTTAAPMVDLVDEEPKETAKKGKVKAVVEEKQKEVVIAINERKGEQTVGAKAQARPKQSRKRSRKKDDEIEYDSEGEIRKREQVILP